ncbi:TPA: DUF551 domain-containing protein [Klebsiella quasipneumoniae]|uniref:DUF551 domain-containing protein n=1 Tax=Klebsiella quasipneumoniae TaxID=1463165 RepID=UPI00403AA4D9
MSSKLTSEILDDETLAELIAFRRSRVEYCQKEGLPYQKALHDSMMLALEELQERRKADSEPVATLDVQSGRPDGHKFSLAYSSVAHKLPDDVYFLYRHTQPAPVVPEEKPIPNTLSMYAVDAVAAIAEVKGWNACRAAMLAAAPQPPGSEPATVPGKWIPVSERMPESNGLYFGWDGKRVLEVYCFFGGFSANQFIHGEITHWMPLPAAPQEVR